MKEEYNELLTSGMFWEFYPELTGIWIDDEPKWKIIYKQLKRSRKNKNKEISINGIN
mgnify:FL=1